MLAKVGYFAFRTALCAVFVGLQYALWLGDASITKWVDLKDRLSHDQNAVSRLVEKNKRLEELVSGLRNGGELTQHYAREKMDMIGKDEVLYRLV